MANSAVLAQNKPNPLQALPDSIQNQLQSADDKILLLLKLRDEYRIKDSAIYHQIDKELQLLEQDKKSLPLLMKAYYELGEEVSVSNWEAQALPYYKGSLAMAQSIKETDFIKKNLFRITGFYLNTQDIVRADSVMTYIEQIIDTSEINNYLAEYYNYKAIINVENGQNNEAIDNYTKAASIYKNLDNSHALATVYNNIGEQNISIGNFKAAINYTQKSLEINKQLDLAESTITNYNNLGVIYKTTDSIDRALEHYAKASEQAEKLNNEFLMARVFLNIANLYLKIKDYKTALAYFDKSEFLCEKNNIPIGIYMNKINKTQLMLDVGNIVEAEKLLKQAMQLVESMNLQLYLPNTLSISAELYSRKGDFETALRDYKQYVSIRDSIKSSEVKLKLLDLNAKYEKEESLRKIVELEKSIEINEAQERIKLLVFISAILLLISLSGFLISKRRESIYKSKITKEENDKLRLNVELKDKELVHYTMSSAKNNELISTMKKGLRAVMPGVSAADQQKLNTLIRELSQNIVTDSQEEMEARFAIVHDSFHQSLLQLSADLSPSELRMCSYLRLNLSTKDISNLTNRSSKTVDNVRSSIRKKLGLATDENLTAFLMRI